MGVKRIVFVCVLLAVCLYVHQNSHSLLERLREVAPGAALILEAAHSILADRPFPASRLLTSEELSRHSTVKEGLYLAVLGKVYDVSKGVKHYGPGGSYHAFTGRDASRAFTTGDFTEAGLVDEVFDLSPAELRSVANWQHFYQREYSYVGLLVGRFYDSSGRPTDYLRRLLLKMEEDRTEKEVQERSKQEFPDCNVEWSLERGTRVWCTKFSGGISRDWTGVPRMAYEPGAESHRCACVRDPASSSSVLKGAVKFREYEGCHPWATECHVVKA